MSMAVECGIRLKTTCRNNFVIGWRKMDTLCVCFCYFETYAWDVDISTTLEISMGCGYVTVGGILRLDSLWRTIFAHEVFSFEEKAVFSFEEKALFLISRHPFHSAAGTASLRLQDRLVSVSELGNYCCLVRSHMSFPDSPGVAIWNANSCYLAAALQMLLLQGAVVAWLLVDLPEELPQETKVIRALRDVVRTAWRYGSACTAAASSRFCLNALRVALSERNPAYATAAAAGSPQDARGCLVHLLDVINAEAVVAKLGGDMATAVEARDFSTAQLAWAGRGCDPIRNNFTYVERVGTQCYGCGETTERYRTQIAWKVSVGGTASPRLQDCLESVSEVSHYTHAASRQNRNFQTSYTVLFGLFFSTYSFVTAPTGNTAAHATVKHLG